MINLIDKEIAKLAKEKGFKPRTLTSINTFDASLGIKQGIMLNHYCKLLLMEEIKNWFRLEHNIEINVYRTAETTTGEKYGCMGENWNGETEEEFDLFNFYDITYEGAFEKGLLQSLKII